MAFKLVTVAQLPSFDEIIDVRSPAEFAEDHIPGAINCPVLSDEERAQVGTLYKQVSPFAARKVGGALVARNIAQHLEQKFQDRPQNWRPLIYCWRGGQRSGSMATIFSQVGWNVGQLEGGYKAYRHMVRQQLAELPQRLRFKVLCGPTGSGKSRLLEALAQAGQQVLDLEQLARHRGSVLGALPDQPQPAQKWFDSQLLAELKQFDAARPVYIEAESKKIGLLQLPDALFGAMHDSDCLVLEVPLAERLRFLQEDYNFFLQQPERLVHQLGYLQGRRSNAELQEWADLAYAGRFAELVEQLLTRHYDPLYWSSMERQYGQLASAPRLVLDSLAPEALAAEAARLD